MSKDYEKTSPDGVSTAPEVVHDSRDMKKDDIGHVERVLSAEDAKVDHLNYDRVDDELAKYAEASAIEITEEENARLKKMIDRRVLPIMVFTYFLQSLDKGTMSATSIMGIREDIPVLKLNSVVSEAVFRHSMISRRLQLLVRLAHDMYLSCRVDRRVPHQLDSPARTYR